MYSTQQIVPVSNFMSYLDGFNEVRDKGGLPSNVLHDEVLVYSNFWQKLRNAFGFYYSAWCREIIAYPSKYGVFGKGDIKDDGCGWVLPARYVPKAAIGKKGIALVIDPKDLRVIEGTTQVIPRTVHLIKKFPQTNGWYGFDEATRVPIDEEPKSDAENAKRYLWRRYGQSVRPLARYDGNVVVRRVVDADWRPDGRLGVGFVKPQAKLKPDAEPEVNETFTTKTGRNRTIKLPDSIRVKQGREVEVTLRTL